MGKFTENCDLSVEIKSTIEELDRVEGADLNEPLFTREIIGVIHGNNQVNWALCYLYSRSCGDERTIQSGVWDKIVFH